MSVSVAPRPGLKDRYVKLISNNEMQLTSAGGIWQKPLQPTLLTLTDFIIRLVMRACPFLYGPMISTICAAMDPWNSEIAAYFIARNWNRQSCWWKNSPWFLLLSYVLQLVLSFSSILDLDLDFNLSNVSSMQLIAWFSTNLKTVPRSKFPPICWKSCPWENI